jgi:hypothetical protein
MPNHVDNRLTITGDKTELIRFVSATYEGNNDYNFNKLVPLDPRASKEIRNERPDGTVQVFGAFSSAEDGFDGYQNAIDVWGTKWGAYDIQAGGAWYEILEKEDYHDITFHYQSAWSPARKLIQRISAQFPTLAFGVWYTEEGMGFAGWQLCKNGKLVDENDYDMSGIPSYDWEDEAQMEKHEQAMDELYETIESALDEATMELMVGQ